MKNATWCIILLTATFLFSCTQTGQPDQEDFTERNKASIRNANEELFNKGNLSYADEVFTSDYAGEGPEWIKKRIGEMKTAFPDTRVTIDPIIAEDDMTAWVRTHTATHKGAYMGFEPTNEQITWKTMIFSEYNDEGKVVKEWAVSDLYEVLAKNQMEAASQEENNSADEE